MHIYLFYPGWKTYWAAFGTIISSWAFGAWGSSCTGWTCLSLFSTLSSWTLEEQKGFHDVLFYNGYHKQLHLFFKFNNLRVDQLLPENQALLFPQHLPGQRGRGRGGGVSVCERYLINEVIFHSNVNLKIPSFTVALRAWLPLSPKMAGERDDTRGFNLSSGGGQIGRLQRKRPLTSPFALERAHISCPLPRALLDSCPVDSPIHHRCNHYSLSHKPTVHPAGGGCCSR